MATKKTVAKKSSSNAKPTKKVTTSKNTAVPAKKATKVVKPAAAKAKIVAKSKPIAKKLVANAKPVMKAAPAPMAKAPTLAKSPMAAAPAAAVKKNVADYKVGDFVVYPTHGVGKITGEETQEIGGYTLKLLVISFEKDKMTLRVPMSRAEAAGLRNISSMDQIEKAFTTLKGRAKAGRGMWSRRAQEYEAKINSGNLISVAEVVRDLHKNVDQSERSYSERMIYESAFARMVGELAAAQKIDMPTATTRLLEVLKKQVAA